MIIDSINNAKRYFSVHPYFPIAFDFLKKANSLPCGRYEIDGDNVYATISNNQLRESGELEAHKKYIDIQMVISGSEKYRCKYVCNCNNISKPYDEKSDIIFFSDSFSMEYLASEGTISVFFPGEAHTPLIGVGSVKKIVVKVRTL